jgi:hypothetical protein
MADQKVYQNLVVKGGNKVFIGSNAAGNEVPTLAGSETLTNKTLSSPVINTPTGLVKADVGLSNVDNTSDANKPISSATQTALNGKANSSHTHASSDITDFTSAAKSAVVDDAIVDGVSDKAPSQNAVFDALALKASSSHNHAIADVTGLQTALNAKIESSEKGAALGVATLDAGGKVPVSQLPNSLMEYLGTFDPNSTSLANGTGNAGDVYVASASGSKNFGAGAISFLAGDWVIYSGSIWEKSINSNVVASVNGFTGAVVLTTSDVAQGTNLYFTDALAQSAVVTQVITNGVTNKAPSEDAVFDALAGKANSSHAHAIADVTGLQTALDGKEATITAGTTSQYFRGDKSFQTLDKSAVGLSNVDNVQQLPSSYLDTDGTLAANSDVKVASQKAAKTYVDAHKNDTNNPHSVTKAQVLSGNLIVNADVDSSAAIAYSKLNIADADLSIAKTNGLQTALNSKLNRSAGDIDETSFSAANNQSSFANITGFAFANASVRSFKAFVSVAIDATASKFEMFELNGIQKGSSWDMSISSVGDDSGVSFQITNAGQIQYTSSSDAGFVSNSMKFRALVTSI